MSSILDRFSLDAIKFDYQVLVGLVIIWLFTIGCALHSVHTQGFSRQRRVIWSLIIICLPVIGILLYLPFSFRLEHYPDLFIWKKPSGKTASKS